MLEIAFKAKAYINENIDEISSTCFALLNALMKRGELSLAHLGFNLSQASSQDLSPNSFKNKKVYIALKYQELLNELMNLTLFGARAAIVNDAVRNVQYDLLGLVSQINEWISVWSSSSVR